MHPPPPLLDTQLANTTSLKLLAVLLEDGRDPYECVEFGADVGDSLHCEQVLGFAFRCTALVKDAAGRWWITSIEQGL